MATRLDGVHHGRRNTARILSLSAGDNSTCAVDQAGQTFCWGCGGLGRLRNAGSENHSTLLAVVGDHTLLGASTERSTGDGAVGHGPYPGRRSRRSGFPAADESFESLGLGVQGTRGTRLGANSPSVYQTPPPAAGGTVSGGKLPRWGGDLAPSGLGMLTDRALLCRPPASFNLRVRSILVLTSVW